MSLLVVAGEPSGDRIAALTVRALRDRGFGGEVIGAGGPACRAAGVTIVADAERFAAMGALDVARRIPAIARGIAALAIAVARRSPRAALLVNASDLSALVGPALRARGVRVLLCVAPQVWAWRAGRTKSLGRAVDKLAVILPFEEALWRRAGVDARYVGHPSLDVILGAPSREALRSQLGIGAGAIGAAVLPGSRAGEVARMAAPLMDAAIALRDEGAIDEARMIEAPSLPPKARAIARAIAAERGIAIASGDADHGAAPLLGAFDLTLTASGTASLEAALAGASPVVAHRIDALGYAIAKRLVTSPHIALPNVLLGRRAFAELVQDQANARAIAEAARATLLRRDEARAASDELRALLAPPGGEGFGARVAALLAPWLDERA